MQFLKKNFPPYDLKTIFLLSQIKWLRTMFTTIGIHLIHDKIQNVELYYRRRPKKRTKFNRILKKLVNENNSIECEKLMHLFFSSNGWIRLTAVDFQANHQYIKIYLETKNPDLIYQIADNFKNTLNQKIIYKLIEYTRISDISFCGLAIVMSKDNEDIRYNFYFKQK